MWLTLLALRNRIGILMLSLAMMILLYGDRKSVV
mgnify:CR=1 FL=1